MYKTIYKEIYTHNVKKELLSIRITEAKQVLITKIITRLFQCLPPFFLFFNFYFKHEMDITVPLVYALFCVSLTGTSRMCPCGTKGQFTCSSCHKQAYCSPKCQTRDWPRHSEVCSKFNWTDFIIVTIIVYCVYFHNFCDSLMGLTENNSLQSSS